MEIKGTIHKIFPVQQISETFKKREVVIKYAEGNTQYPDFIKMEMIQDSTALLDNFQEGQNVLAIFVIKGREWFNPKTNENNYFNTLQIRHISAISGNNGETASGTNMQASTPAFQPPAPAANTTATSNNDNDDLPF